MRLPLSEAILAGRVLLKLTPQYWFRGDRDEDCGCLIGMAMAAEGYATILREMMFQQNFILQTHPWLKNEVNPPALQRPHCELPASFQEVFAGIKSPIIFIISAMAYSVSEGLMTIEQAVDWIRSVEPAEKEEQHAAVLAEERESVPAGLCGERV